MFYVALRVGFVGHSYKLNNVVQIETTKDIRKAQPFTTMEEADAVMKANYDHRQYAILSTCLA